MTDYSFRWINTTSLTFRMPVSSLYRRISDNIGIELKALRVNTDGKSNIEVAESATQAVKSLVKKPVVPELIEPVVSKKRFLEVIPKMIDAVIVSESLANNPWIASRKEIKILYSMSAIE